MPKNTATNSGIAALIASLIGVACDDNLEGTWGSSTTEDPSSTTDPNSTGDSSEDMPGANGVGPEILQTPEQAPQALFADSNLLWSPGKVPVCWENPSDADAWERSVVRAQIEGTWSANSAASFDGWEKCSAFSQGIRIRIADEGAHTKGLGTELNGVTDGMVLNFTFNKWKPACPANWPKINCIAYIAMHEFGHALGFAHEQNRTDTPAWCQEPPQGQNGNLPIGPWDSKSVMNYCTPYWEMSNNLSTGDIKGVQATYGVRLFDIFTMPNYVNLKGDVTNLITGDFNGDGRTDFIRQEKGAWDDDNVGTAAFWLSNGNGTFTIVTPTNADNLKGDYTNLITGDFNGDHRTDFIRQEKGSWDDDNVGTAEVWLSNGNGTFSAVAPGNANNLKGDGCSLIPGDFNGDGRTDFIRQEKNSWDDDSVGTADVWLSNGNGTFVIVVPGNADVLKGDQTNLIPGDFNGDHRTDFIRQEKNAWDDDNVGTMNVWLSKGDGTFNVVTPGNSNNLKGDVNNLIPGDFNGDGLTDFLRQEKGAWDDDDVGTADVWLSVGNGNYNVLTPGNANYLKGDYTALSVGDFNNDGRTDFIRQERSTWDDDRLSAEIWLATGSAEFNLVVPNDPVSLAGDGTKLILGDFNGDGRMDFIRQEWGKWDDDDNVRTAELFQAK